MNLPEPPGPVVLGEKEPLKMLEERLRRHEDQEEWVLRGWLEKAWGACWLWLGHQHERFRLGGRASSLLKISLALGMAPQGVRRCHGGVLL